MTPINLIEYDEFIKLSDKEKKIYLDDLVAVYGEEIKRVYE